MEDELTQPATQVVLDPRRLGRNNSSLSDSDTSDVICILTPATPAAFKIVQVAAQRTPQHVLQSRSPPKNSSPEVPSEAGTFIANSQGSVGEQRHNGALDLALRFSSGTIRPYMGFCWGRNNKFCDILITVDTTKRVSNSHFRIYLNESGIIMLEDTSTNGTMVDDHHLKGKAPPKNGQKGNTRMLQNGSIIQILSTKHDEWIKFTVWIPPRGDFIAEYEKKFTKYMNYVEQDQQRFLKAQAENMNEHQNGAVEKKPAMAVSGRGFHSRAAHTRNFGMQWDGSGIYNVVGLLGKGAFATVYSIAKAIDGTLLAAKELEKRRFIKNGKLDQRLDNEMKIMKTLRHPNIVQYIDYHDIGNHIYIIMEHVPCGDLQSWLSANHVLPEDKAKRMARQILSSLGYLHQKQITHRDIKPDNILIASEDPFEVKLSDFGLSKVVKNNETFLKTFCGTLLYCAPEVFPHYEAHASSTGTKRRRGQHSKSQFHSYSQSVDIWSFAAVLWFALCNKPPFEGVVDGTGQGMFEKIMETQLDVSDLREQNISDEGIDLLTQMLNTDPAARPTEKECLAHPWLSDGMVEKLMLDYELDAIEEEDEVERDVAEAVAEEAQAELSQLSIKDGGLKSIDRGRTYAVPSYNEEEDEVDAEDFEFLLDSRRSKRVKTDLLFPRNQVRDQDPLDSSPEVSLSVPRMHDQDASYEGAAHMLGPTRLFGEIGKSALQSSGILGEHLNRALAANNSAESNEDTEIPSDALVETEQVSETEMARLVDTANGVQAAASLLGAESMVRELNMASPQSGNSPVATPNEPVTPQTPDPHQNTSSSHGQSQEETPKAAPVFNRQINLEKTPSFYWDPYDPSTHTLEYASQKSGRDFVAEATAAAAAAAATASAPQLGEQIDHVPLTNSIGASSDHGSIVGNVKAISSAPGSQSTPEFLRPSPVFGKLTPTPESIDQAPLRLEHRVTSFGRQPGCTIRWERKVDQQGSGSYVPDTRVSKMAFGIYFEPIDGPKALKEAGDNWHKLPDLYTGIFTTSRNGIRINGVRLPPRDPIGQRCYGHLHTGDIIEVFHDPSDDSCLRYKCEFFYGEAKGRRLGLERFVILKAPDQSTQREHSATPV